MVDVQGTHDFRGIEIESVGICDLQIQITICSEPTLAYINLGVSLDKQQKGIHMSRLVEIINNFVVLDNNAIFNLLKTASECQDSTTSDVEIYSTFFVQKTSPISRRQGKLNYPIHVSARFSVDSGFNLKHTIDIPVTAVCPCSKAISQYGAHNQRGVISVSLTEIDVTDYLKVIKTVENVAPSQELFTILKRADEKYVTEHAFENPKFVEDIVRDTLLGLNSAYSGKILSVKAKNFESIHYHNAYAHIVVPTGQ